MIEKLTLAAMIVLGLLLAFIAYATDSKATPWRYAPPVQGEDR